MLAENPKFLKYHLCTLISEHAEYHSGQIKSQLFFKQNKKKNFFNATTQNLVLLVFIFHVKFIGQNLYFRFALVCLTNVHVTVKLEEPYYPFI